MTLPSYAVSFRGFWACPCQVAWIPEFERALRFYGVLEPDEQISIAQLIGLFEASGGTHADGGSSDFWLVGARAEKAVWVARQMGADATWHRLAGWDNGGGSEHVHSVPRDCPHLSTSARAQISAVDGNGDGLGGTTIPDPGPRPLSGRTWREGIAWWHEQEDDMADQATQDKLDRILEQASAAASGITALRGAEADRAKANRKRDEALLELVETLASAKDMTAVRAGVKQIKTLLQEHDAEEATP